MTLLKVNTINSMLVRTQDRSSIPTNMMRLAISIIRNQNMGNMENTETRDLIMKMRYKRKQKVIIGSLSFRKKERVMETLRAIRIIIQSKQYRMGLRI